MRGVPTDEAEGSKALLDIVQPQFWVAGSISGVLA